MDCHAIDNFTTRRVHRSSLPVPEVLEVEGVARDDVRGVPPAHARPSNLLRVLLGSAGKWRVAMIHDGDAHAGATASRRASPRRAWRPARPAGHAPAWLARNPALGRPLSGTNC